MIDLDSNVVTIDKTDSPLGISDNKLKHSLGVARRCYVLAKEHNFSENLCLHMYVVGMLHDIGYDFTDVSECHPEVGYEILRSAGLDAKEVLHHGKPITNEELNQTVQECLNILNEADLTVSYIGELVPVTERLESIKDNYGKNSHQYINSVELAIKLGLLNK